MAKKNRRQDRAPEPRLFVESRTIDVSDRDAMRFWSDRLGVPEAEIVEVVQEVGPNSTAVALKLEAPYTDRIVTPSLPAR